MKHVFSFLAVAAFLSACTQDELTDNGQDTPLPAGKYPLEFTVSGLEAVATPAEPSTRGTVDGDWNGVTNIPIQIGNEVKTYTLNASEDWKTATLSGYDDPFYWERADETKVVSAWYSRRDLYKNTMPYSGENYKISSTQNLTTFAQDDILWAHRSVSFQGSKELSFSHLLSKLTINLVSTPYLNTYNKNQVSVKLASKTDKSWSTGGEFYFDNDNLHLRPAQSSSGEDIIPYRLANPTDRYYATYEALVIPQQITNTGKTIQVKVGDATYEWEVTCAQNVLYGNYLYIYDITVKEEGLRVTTNQSIGWNISDKTGSGSITLP